MARARKKFKTIKIQGCAGCPHVVREPGCCGSVSFRCGHPESMETVRWPGTEYPDERRGRVIAQDCEFLSEHPTQWFPKWCPL